MTPRQKMLIKATWQQVVPMSEAAAQLFYARLFELKPELSVLFKGDMPEQGRKLMRMIGVAVNGLDRLPELVPAVQDLGRRHVAYGVKDEDYDTVGKALLWTLEEGLGKAFTAEVREAWATVYWVLADTMKGAARAAAAA